MKSKVVIVADLGVLKLYRLFYRAWNRSPKIDLVETFHTSAARGRISEKLSDEAGRFAGGSLAIKGLRACGERHNIKLEMARRALAEISARINAFLSRDDSECYLAASQKINRALLEKIRPAARRKIVKNIPEDFARLGKSDLLRRFAVAA